QGYDATTVSQIADAVEISESTFFRYFPTKEAVVMWDDLDPAFEAVYRAQPPEVSPIAAMRAATRIVFAQLPDAQRAEQRERWTLGRATPQLRSAILDQFTGSIDQIAGLIAMRTDRRPDEFAVRAMAGAVIGVAMAVMMGSAADPDADFIDLIDRAFAQLEAGL